MKRTILLLMLAACTMAVAQQVNLGLIPTPQQVMHIDSTRMVNLEKAKIKETRLPKAEAFDNADQYYTIRFEPRRITVSYCSEQGRDYAYMTLSQLRLLHKTVPSMTIIDWPAYKYRAWMDDISRGPVPHQAYRDRQWQVLHALKYNISNYYTEHTLYQYDYPDLAPAYADAKRHSDEVINLQLFAHAEKTLRSPFYQYMMDSKANFNPNTEATYDFLRSRVREAWRQMPLSPLFIIDCDETEQLGTGRAKALVDSLGADNVYVRHINRCYEIVKDETPHEVRQKAGCDAEPRVLMWGDIVAKNPDMMRDLPSDMVYIMWAYEPLESYAHLIRPFREQGNPFWVAPSLSHSGNMIPAPQRYMKNIANLARDGYRAGAEGLMNTCWDDNGEALFDNCWHGLFWSAEMAWNPIRSDDPEELRRREEQFNENFARLFYSNQEGGREAVATLYAFGKLEADPTTADLYTSAQLMQPLLDLNPSVMQRDPYAIYDALIAAETGLDSALNPHAHYALVRMLSSVDKLILQQEIGRQLAEGGREYECRALVESFVSQLMHVKHEYLRLWDQENGEYERYIVCHRYDDMAREALELDRHVFVEVEASTDGDVPQVSLATLYGDRPIYYTLDGSEPSRSSTRYVGPFRLERSATIKAVAYNEYDEGVVTEQYLLSHKAMGAKISLGTPYSTYRPIYSGGGNDALIDGRLGSDKTYADGRWQGYWGDSIDATIDMGRATEMHMVDMRFMQNTFDWILAPTRMLVYASDDGDEWRLVADKEFDMDPRETGMRLKHCMANMEVTARWLRVVVPNPGVLPSWHPAPGQPSYLFCDEIVVL